MTQQYDFAGKVREEVDLLQHELAEPEVRESLKAAAQRLQLPPDVALAALYRAAKRSGYTLKLLLEELNRQLDAQAQREITKRK